MSDIYALQGPSNCGKSATLVQLFQTLQATYPAAAIQTLHSSNTEVSVIMRGLKGLVVGIESHGDPNSRLQQSLPLFAAASCDIIFCACRTSGMTVSWVNALHPGYSIHFVRKHRAANNHAAANAAVAASLRQQAGV